VRASLPDATSRMGAVQDAAARLLRSDEDLSPDGRRALRTIGRNLRAIAAVNSVVQELQPGEADFEEVDPADLCAEVLADLDLPKQCLVVQGSPRRWEVVPGFLALALENLLKNSMEAHARRQIDRSALPVRVTIIFNQGRIEVRDTAGGIDPGLPDVFSPYISEKGIQQGSGLGLAQARSAVQLMDGHLTLAAQQPAGGAAFVIEVPL